MDIRLIRADRLADSTSTSHSKMEAGAVATTHTARQVITRGGPTTSVTRVAQDMVGRGEMQFTQAMVHKAQRGPVPHMVLRNVAAAMQGMVSKEILARHWWKCADV
jgi:hypothetical protein